MQSILGSAWPREVCGQARTPQRGVGAGGVSFSCTQMRTHVRAEHPGKRAPDSFEQRPEIILMQITKQVSLSPSRAPHERITVLYKNVIRCANYSSFKHSNGFGPNICFLDVLANFVVVLEQMTKRMGWG